MIEEKDAVATARARAAELGWAFGDPLVIAYSKGWFGGPGKYEIEANALTTGPHARFTVSARTGRITHERYD